MPPRRQTTTPTRLQEALALHKFILHLLGHKDFETLSHNLKDQTLEGIDDEGTSRLYYALIEDIPDTCIPKEQLLEYDQNIVRHTREINELRQEKIQWKYFQYLALLFTEIYLDRYFTDNQRLLSDINDFLTGNFNNRENTWHEMSQFTEDDLKKLAFWCATGSGKTLLMHINIKQYMHYAEKHHAKELNRILILTPNEGLSEQHIKELTASHIKAELFSKQAEGGMFIGKVVQVIDINKLADTDGDKTVAVESFEGNNLVLVDEGHKGSGGEVWKGYRNTLTKEGFSFEYSATFGQAIAAQTGTNRKSLLEEYGKATLFDYSYRYFYNDGYGKDYRIMNMDSVENDELLNMYLTAYLLSLYEQTIAFEYDVNTKNKFLVAHPLGIFVGSSVNAVRLEGGRKVSDVVKILLFLQAFIDHPQEFCGYIKRLLDPEDGIRNARGYSLFANNFLLTKAGLISGEEDAFAEKTYRKIIERLFHSSVPNAHLYIDKQKGGNGEIGLRVGSAPYFGVINVGDSDNLIKLCENNDLNCETKEFWNTSLFSDINEENSNISILIGSKKFSEGWSSWRVSAMGLMNVGRSEGSEIIQLFGRGVRLKGFKYSLKRSNALDSSYNPGNLPKGLQEIETLNIFGIRADYMQTFKKFLEEEGLPHNEDNFTSIVIPTVNLLGENKLKIVRLKKNCNFKKSVIVHPEELKDDVKVSMDFRPKIDVINSQGVSIDEAADLPKGKLSANHLSLLNWNKIFFAIESMKDERGWYNMEISLSILKNLMKEPSWYEMIVQPADLEFRDFERDVMRWQDMTIVLLRAFIDKAYKKSKAQWESQRMEVVYLDKSDPNFFAEYSAAVRNDKNEWIEKLKELSEVMNSDEKLTSDFSIYNNWIKAIHFDQHLFSPLLCLRERDGNGRFISRDRNTNEPLIKISPIALNEGEKKFVESIRSYYLENKDGYLQGKDVYLLRNESRKGIGFFESNNFYPDFILWVNKGRKQHVTFIDPKGIRNLKGLNDSKIQLFKTLREVIEPSLKDRSITLDSYIISNTPYEVVSFWDTLEKFKENHILFDTDNNYIDQLFHSILD